MSAEVTLAVVLRRGYREQWQKLGDHLGGYCNPLGKRWWWCGQSSSCADTKGRPDSGHISKVNRIWMWGVSECENISCCCSFLFGWSFAHITEKLEMPSAEIGKTGGG